MMQQQLVQNVTRSVSECSIVISSKDYLVNYHFSPTLE